jgi:DNA-binding IclR family transcriptional regulator
MECSRCGAENQPNARFCKQCGQPLTPPTGITCPDCGLTNNANALFCRQCGKPLPAQAPAAERAPATAQPESVSVHIEGNVSGQVAIGNNILQIGDVHGGVVNVMAPGEKIQPKLRPTPVDLRPRPFPGLLDREKEIGAATAVLQSAQPVEFHAAAGSGKTSLLRCLAHHPAVATFPDGVVYLSTRHQPAADLLQSLYDAFYETDVPFKPTDAQLKHDLQNTHALILLDDVELAREDVEAMMNTAPACTFLLASPERRLWGEGQSLALGGLPPDDALALIERELGRPLTPQERPVAQRLRVHAKGNPLALIQIAAEVREKGVSLTELPGQKEKPEGMRTTDLLEFPKQQMQLVRYITRQGEATLEAAAEHLGETPANTQHMLDALVEKGYLERVEKKGNWIYRMSFAHKGARKLPPGIWCALEQETEGVEATAFVEALNALPATEQQIMAALAALGGAPVHAEHLAAMTGIADVAPILQALQRRGLAQAHSPRYSLTGGLDATLQQVWDLTPWMERALAYFTTWAEAQQQTPKQLSEEADAIQWILKWAADANRWADVLRLGRAVEGALALSGRWAAWAQVLRWILQAGQALGDQAAEAWALHQLGTRSLCLGDGAAARTSLTQALQLREALGDHAGAAITKHNLDLISAAPPTPPEEPPEEPPAPKARPPLPKWLLPTAAIAAVGGIIAVAGAVLIIAGALPTPPPPPTDRPVETKAPTNAPTRTPTRTPTEGPWISIELEDGCDREYEYSDETRLLVESNVGGPAKIQLDDEPAFGATLEPGQVWDAGWGFADIQPGEHELTAALMSPEGTRLDEARCAFTLKLFCIDFEDLPVDTQYIEGDEFASSGVKIVVADGTMYVEDGGHAGGSGKEINLESAYLEFTFGRPLNGLDLHYSQEPLVTPFSELVINDDSWSGSLLDSADGEVIGRVSVTAGGGVLRLDGRINSFIIGGSDLYIDDVCSE